MRVEKLNLDHKKLVRDKLAQIKTPVSEYSFANLYLFRDKHNYTLVQDNDLWITGTSYRGFTYAMPLFDPRRVHLDVSIAMIKHSGSLYPIPEDWAGIFDRDRFTVTTDEADWDYAFAIEGLRAYGGKKYHKKRNLLKQFIESYSHEALPLTNDSVEDARRVLEQWQQESDQAAEETDYAACMEALSLYEELVLCGVIYYTHGEPAGFIIGEELNEKVFALYFAKGLRGIKGIYQFMYNNFALIMPSKYYAFNFEQDLGDPGLRQSKRSYFPEYMIKKYKVELKS